MSDVQAGLRGVIPRVRVPIRSLRVVLSGLRQVRHVNMPRYDELSVKKFWPLMQKDAIFMLYMPDPTADGRLPEREYFWNVLNTLRT